MTKQKFDVGGMSCAACSSGIEKAVSKIQGVKSVQVSLLEKTMTAEFDESSVSAQKIIATVEKLGYTAAIFGVSVNKYADAERLKKRFFLSLIFLIPLMYISMGGMFGAPTFSDISHLGAVIDLVLQFALSTAIIIVNFNFYYSGVRAIKNLSPNMDTLVFLGSFTAYVYSVAVSVLIIVGKMPHTHVFFESAAMVEVLVSLGKYLEEISKRKTGEEIEKLNKLLPKSVTVLIDGKEETVLTSLLKEGDVVVLKAGDYCPIDGKAIEGIAGVDKSAVTGESIPEEATVGSEIVSGSILRSGYLLVSAEKVGEDTMFSKIVEAVKSASASRVPIQKLADKVSAVFVPTVTVLAVLTFVLQLLLNQDGGLANAIKCAISVIVISCPCALGLATPVAVMAATGKAASLGILIKDAEAIQKIGKINCALFDKTATITEGTPKVVEYKNFSEIPDEKVFAITSALEKMSNHPLAEAMVEFCGDSDEKAENFYYEIGKGIYGTVNGEKYFLGTYEEELFEGKTSVALYENGKPLAAFAIADTVKKDSKNAIRLLNAEKIKTVMITGDKESAAKSVAEEVGISGYEFSVLPEGKASYVKKYKDDGYFVAFVGDGINDSPALKTADVGVAMGNGTDIAIESSDIVIIGGSLVKTVDAVNLSKKALSVIKGNLFWAFFYNVIAIPIAAGVFAPLGIVFEPWIAAICMSLSSLFVVLNALRINGYGNAERISDKGEKHMKVKIEGMMCKHCEKRVYDALSVLDGVSDVEVHLKRKFAKLTGDVKEEDVRKAIETAGYTVKEIK